MPLPLGAKGLSAVCDVVFPDHTHLLFFFLDFIDSVVVEAQNIFSSLKGFLTVAMYHHRETISSN